MFELLVFGTVWFWISLVILTVAVIACIENENGGGALFALIVVGLLYYFFGEAKTWSVWGWMLQNPLSSLLLFVSYFAVGTIWCFVKWYYFLLDTRDVLEEGQLISADDVPTAKDHKRDIVRWISYWPFSFIWWVVGDFITRIARAIFERIQRLLNKMSLSVFDSVIDKRTNEQILKDGIAKQTKRWNC